MVRQLQGSEVGAGRRWKPRLAARLATATGAGLLAAVLAGSVGLVGLSSVASQSHTLANTAQTLKHVAELRDAEGDMRVEVHDAAAARNTAELQSTLTATQGSDARVDGLVADLRQDLASNAAAMQDLNSFSNGLATWRRIRDTQVLAAARKADSLAARRIVAGPLASADDAFATPLDHLVEAINAQVAPATTAADTAVSRSTIAVLLALGLGIALAGVLSVLTIRSILGPLRLVIDVLTGLADGDLTRVAAIDTRDEMGTMAQALDRAVGQMRSTVQSLSVSAQSLAGASEELSANSTQIASSAQETATEVEVASGAVRQISTNVRSVAAGAEQMTASIGEISSNAAEAARVAAHAVEAADAANTQVARLGASSAEIGDVIKVITSIAEQTNLLALNATIEAARAGTAGKWFAVVADEVKQLAQQTALATGQIGQRIEAIQGDAGNAVAAIGEISEIIQRINDYQTTIASAVEEQTATTNEMRHNVLVAADSSEQVSANITGVARAATSTTSGVRDAQRAAGELAQMSSELQRLVDHFRY